jgi:glutamate dehydrogenase
MSFRNTFHLHHLASADIFVPCGGRPESVNIANVKALMRDGLPKFKAIIEGPNFFAENFSSD